MSPAAAGNPDQALIRRFLAEAGGPMAIDSNAFAVALGACLLRVDSDSGIVELAFMPQNLFVQGTGVLQGGAVSAMLDFAMAMAVLSKLPADHSCSTVNLNVAFLRAAPHGRYVAKGELERRTRALAFTRAQLVRDGDGTVVATATSTLALVERRPTDQRPSGI